MDSVTFHDEPPAVGEYLALRTAVHFSRRSPDAAELGLSGSLYAVTARLNGRAVGMARVVGDGGSSFLVVDVIVLPDYQGQGIGSEIMRRLSNWCDENVPPTGMICLLADEPGRKLYERHGFRYTAPESLGMKRQMP